MSNTPYLSAREISGITGMPSALLLSFAEQISLPKAFISGEWQFDRRHLLDGASGTSQNTDAAQTRGDFYATDSRDLDHYRAQPGNWNVKVDQISKGSFRSQINAIRLPGLTLYNNRWGCDVMVRGEAPAGVLMLGADVNPQRSDIRWCGKKADNRIFACTSPGRSVDFTATRSAHDIVILAEQEVLAAAAGHDAVDTILRHNHLKANPLASVQLVELALQLISYLQRGASLLAYPGIVVALRSTILDAVADCFACGEQPGSELSVQSREEAVHAAIMHADSCDGHTSAGQMAEASGVSQRTLENSFKQSLGTTPGKYLRLIRLNGAHHALAGASRDSTTVTDISHAWGFSHSGRFSAAYRQLFNELPSKTLLKNSPGIRTR